ncbi:MAG: hypothetical protein CMJ78_16990 [Planctomycetaceae bacterium]|nr:hypothetical protein [Planctomycetaceae bacterium]
MSRSISFILLLFVWGNVSSAQDDFAHFERRVRPLLAAKCWECHGKETQEGGFRLDTAANFRKGGESGPVVARDNLAGSLLLKAVRHTGDLKMPPEGKLTAAQIKDLEKWILAGARWPNDRGEAVTVDEPTRLIKPNAEQLKSSLQLWLKADAVNFPSETSLAIWPDQSGHGRDLAITKGIRKAGVGTAPSWVPASEVNGRPAVRFRYGNGLAASPGNQVDINGDAAVTIFVVANLNREKNPVSYGNVLTIGNPAATTNPGRALAAYIEFQKTGDGFDIDFAGGWNHDVKLGKGSGNLMLQPRILTIVKRPGPMAKTTSVFIDGIPSSKHFGQEQTGPDTVPNITHTDTMGVSIGKAAAWQQGISGDFAEVIVFNRAIADEQRRGIEAYLADKYEFFSEADFEQATRQFTDKQKSHWALQPLDASLPPKPTKQPIASREPGNEIDEFTSFKLRRMALKRALQADRATLIRRLTYDLTGLPPTPAEIQEFLDDNSPDDLAYERLVDRLLASPKFGIRWGRVWLDAVRYADTTANDGNFVMRYAFRYRDYVVDAFNHDKPYDDFVREQLAGDLMESATPEEKFERTVATGFLMVGPKALAETDKEQVKLDIADEQLDVTSRALMGLTVSCARCHDHKFDPIPTVDYYSMAGIFRSTEVFADLVRNASMWLEFKMSNGQANLKVMAPKEGTSRHLRVHIRGSKLRQGQIAPRRFLQIIAGEGHTPIKEPGSGRLALANWIMHPDHPLTARVIVNRIWQGHFGQGLVATSDNFGTRGEYPSHRSLLDWLAMQLIESDWSLKHVHRLIVTSETYRQQSLDAKSSIAAMYLDGGNKLLWKSSRRRLEAEQLRDTLLFLGGNLDERMRGGELVMELYKAGDVIDQNRGVSSASKLGRDWKGFQSRRHSIYLPVVRNGQPQVLALFDVADANNVVAKRNETTVATQSAFMLNNPFVIEQARGFASRVIAHSTDHRERLHFAYMAVIGRSPSDDEESAALAFIRDIANLSSVAPRLRSRGPANGAAGPQKELATWTSYCQLLFCLNEFLYVE